MASTPADDLTRGSAKDGEASADDAAEPLITSNQAGLPTQVDSRDEPVEIVADGDNPGEEGSAHEGARAGLADLVPDGFGPIGLDDLDSGEQDTEDDSGSLDGLDRPPREVPDFADGGATGGSSETSVGGGGGGKSSSETSFSGGGGGQQGQLQDEFDGRAAPREDYAPGDYGADPDQPPADGNPSAESSGGIVTFTDDRTTEVSTDQTGWTQVTDIDWTIKEGGNVSSALISPDGTYVERISPGEDMVVSDDTGGQNAIIHPDGSMTIIDTKTGAQTTEPPPPKPDESALVEAGTPPDDTEAVLTPAEQQALRDSIDALGENRGIEGTETQPAEGDDGVFGVGAPHSEISIKANDERAIDMLGQPGSSDIDFGGGGGGGGRLPDDGAIDPADGDDVGRQTDGPEQDPFDRQQDTLEPVDDGEDDGSDDDGSDGAELLQPGYARPMEETEHLRNVTIDIG